MTAFDADVLVVGAGPAGSSAAYQLARRGLDVLLVDRAAFPREKVCGDGLTPRAVRALSGMGVDVADPGFVRVGGIRTHGAKGKPLEVDLPLRRGFPGFGLTRRREDLDRLLVEHAIQAGARFRDRTHAQRPLLEGRSVVGGVLANGDGAEQQVRARFVVAADGASSRFASAAGIQRDPAGPVAVAARRYYRSSRRQDPVFEAFLTLRDGRRWLPGYGWTFPMGDGVLNVGAYVVREVAGRRVGVSARRAFDLFVGDLPPAWGIHEANALGPVRSRPIPMAINRRPVGVPGMLVAGDAAGVVNPFSGEGISYAIECGELAARLIARTLQEGDPFGAASYPAKLRERYGRFFGAGRWFDRAVSNPFVMGAAATYGTRTGPVARACVRYMLHTSDR